LLLLLSISLLITTIININNIIIVIIILLLLLVSLFLLLLFLYIDTASMLCPSCMQAASAMQPPQLAKPHAISPAAALNLSSLSTRLPISPLWANSSPPTHPADLLGVPHQIRQTATLLVATATAALLFPIYWQGAVNLIGQIAQHRVPTAAAALPLPICLLGAVCPHIQMCLLLLLLLLASATMAVSQAGLQGVKHLKGQTVLLLQLAVSMTWARLTGYSTPSTFSLQARAASVKPPQAGLLADTPPTSQTVLLLPAMHK